MTSTTEHRKIASDHPANFPPSPLPAQILAAREAAGLTQVQAGALIYTPARTWQDWERGISGMHPGLWRLFLRFLDDIRRSPTHSKHGGSKT